MAADTKAAAGASGEKSYQSPRQSKKGGAVTLTNKYHVTELGVEDQPVPWFYSHIPLGAETGQDSSPNSNF